MSESNTPAAGGISLAGAVFIVFLVLKLIGVAPVAMWSWWWVTAPLWGGAALVLGLCAVVAIVVTCVHFFESATKGRTVR